MNQIRQKKMGIVGIFFAGVALAGFFYGGSKEVLAAERPAYTITKGKRVTIQNIIKKNPLTSPQTSKYKNLKWKSGNKKFVKILSNKKIKGLKKGSTYIRGYNSRKKKVLAIKITVGKKVSKINVPSANLVMKIGG